MKNNTSMINGHIDEPELYIIFDRDAVNEGPVYGVYSSYEKALSACEWIVNHMVEDMLRDNAPEDSGFTENDKSMLKKDCRESLAIQCLYHGLDKIGYNYEVKYPYV